MLEPDCSMSPFLSGVSCTIVDWRGVFGPEMLSPSLMSISDTNSVIEPRRRCESEDAHSHRRIIQMDDPYPCVRFRHTLAQETVE